MLWLIRTPVLKFCYQHLVSRKLRVIFIPELRTSAVIKKTQSNFPHNWLCHQNRACRPASRHRTGTDTCHRHLPQSFCSVLEAVLAPVLDPNWDSNGAAVCGWYWFFTVPLSTIIYHGHRILNLPFSKDWKETRAPEIFTLHINNCRFLSFLKSMSRAVHAAHIPPQPFPFKMSTAYSSRLSPGNMYRIACSVANPYGYLCNLAWV